MHRNDRLSTINSKFGASCVGMGIGCGIMNSGFGLGYGLGCLSGVVCHLCVHLSHPIAILLIQRIQTCLFSRMVLSSKSIVFFTIVGNGIDVVLVRETHLTSQYAYFLSIFSWCYLSKSWKGSQSGIKSIIS